MINMTLFGNFGSGFKHAYKLPTQHLPFLGILPKGCLFLWHGPRLQEHVAELLTPHPASVVPDTCASLQVAYLETKVCLVEPGQAL